VLHLTDTRHKEKFKEICRTITKEIYDKEFKKGNATLSDSAKENAKKFAEKYIKKKIAQTKQDQSTEMKTE